MKIAIAKTEQVYELHADDDFRINVYYQGKTYVIKYKVPKESMKRVIPPDVWLYVRATDHGVVLDNKVHITSPNYDITCEASHYKWLTPQQRIGFLWSFLETKDEITISVD